MRTTGRSLLLGALAGTLVSVTCCASGPERHEDGDGVVQVSPGSTERYRMGPDDPGAEWSYGLFVCTTDPDDPPVLVDVTVTGLAGGATFLGSRLLSDPDAEGEIFATAPGFPPTPLARAAMPEVGGQTLSTPCEADFPAQIMLGVRLSESGEGGFTGEEITYDHGGRRHVLVLHNAFVFCGSGMTAVDACTPRELSSP